MSAAKIVRSGLKASEALPERQEPKAYLFYQVVPVACMNSKPLPKNRRSGTLSEHEHRGFEHEGVSP